jgi:NADH:ubiquinone oxidoreductase subunit F (NADH-binding)
MSARLGIDRQTSLAEHLALHGSAPLGTPAHRGRPGGLVQEVERSGLRGRGGGWFPTARKLHAVVESAAARGRLDRGRRPVVIGNGMEGEPASGKDAALLGSSPHLVLDGIGAAARAIGATDAFLSIHRGSPLAKSLSAALVEREAAGIDETPIRLLTPPARYVASEESALAHWVGDGTATPVYPDRPFQRGAAGRPTLVQNVETLAHLALTARYGGEWFAAAGTPSAPGTTLVTVGGSVRRPGVVEVPTGTTVDEILDLCGGATEPLRGFLTGGYGGGWVGAAGFGEVPWEPDAVRAAGGVIGASVLWALGQGTCPLYELARVTAWMAGESAGQCGPCLFGLPSVADDVHRLAIGECSDADLGRLGDRLRLVSGRGGCKHPDGTARFVATGLGAFDEEVRLHLGGRCSVSTGHRTKGLLPVPTARLSRVDVGQRDFR